MRHSMSLLLMVGLLSACQPQTQTQDIQSSQAEAKQVLSETERLNQWFDEKYEEQLQMSPMGLTFLGRKEKYDQIDDMTEATEKKNLAWLGNTVTELKNNFDYEQLDAEAQTSYDTWIYQYDQALAAQKFAHNEYVFTQMHGVQSFMAQFLISYHAVDTESDMLAYNQRIAGVSTAIKQLLERAKVNAAEGTRAPRFAYEAVIKEASNLISGQPFDDSSNDSPLFADAKRKIQHLLDENTITEERAAQLQQATADALLSDFEPAYQALIDWFNTDITHTDEVAKGVGQLSNGEAFYNSKLSANTTTDLSAEQIHQIGLEEVARITTEMEAIKTQVGFNGTLQAFFHFVRTDPQFFYPDTDEGRQAYLADTRQFLDFIKVKLPDYFGILPKADLEVKRVEAFREQPGAAQHYSSGTPDGSRAGVYYVHLSDMTAMPKNEMEGVAYHEGLPGHHMQISIAQELTSVPQFRTQAGFTAYAEGWGLYAELLAKEMGGYQDPYSDFGRLVNEIWRAVRLVVDTGIHSKGWTEQQANDYFKQNTPIAAEAIKSEVRRYMVLPGQATAYKIGMLKILELRQKAKQQLGDKFDIRGFHDTVLSGGSLPLGILEKRVDHWIEQVKSSQ